MKSWIVYSRSGCGLCEEFMVELARLLGPSAPQVAVVDIDSDVELTRKYSTKIPVLTVDGDFVCNYRVDSERVSRHIER